MTRLRAAALVAAATGLLFLAGCSSTVPMEPAEAAEDPLCAEVMVQLPASVDGQARRWTDAQATAAWGTPARVLFTCGVAVPGPTTLRCEEVFGVDWIIDESQAPRFRLTTYGRTPAIEVFLDSTLDDGAGVSSRSVLNTLSPLISQRIPQDRSCVDRADATPVPEPVDP